MAAWRSRGVLRPKAPAVPAIPSAGGGSAPARSPRKLQHPERHEQKAIVGLLTSLGAKVYVLGTTRKKGDFQGTMMSPGLPDLLVFLPYPKHYAEWPGTEPLRARTLLVIECKAKKGRLRPEQAEFQEMCHKADVHHVVGGLDVVIAFLIAFGFIKAENVPHYRLPKNLQERA